MQLAWDFTTADPRHEDWLGLNDQTSEITEWQLLPAKRVDSCDPLVSTYLVSVDMMHGLGIPALR